MLMLIPMNNAKAIKTGAGLRQLMIKKPRQGNTKQVRNNNAR